jgi:phosphotransferase system HPr (HPr) family protein
MTRRYQVQDAVGLHARPAALLVKAFARYPEAVQVQNGEKRADGKSILQLMALGVKAGQVLTVEYLDAAGKDYGETVGAIEAELQDILRPIE